NPAPWAPCCASARKACPKRSRLISATPAGRNRWSCWPGWSSLKPRTERAPWIRASWRCRRRATCLARRSRAHEFRDRASQPRTVPMAVKKGIRQLVDEANARITTIPVEEARALLGDPDVQFVDIRDVRELEREGLVPGAFHAPRGMLEFWADPGSPYFKPVFGQDRRCVLYCQSGWRSALATAALQDMGLARVAHVAGGFHAWKAAGGEVAR